MNNNIMGLGLRSLHYQAIIDTQAEVDWLEVISENFMVSGGKPKYFLHQIRECYPLVMYDVSLSIGSAEPLDKDCLRKSKVLANEVNPRHFQRLNYQ